MARRPRTFERGSDYLGPAAFFAFSVAGALYIVLAKVFGVGAVWVTAVPVALMAVYAVAIMLVRRFRLRDDQTGDNFYYMGFIFTLTSLAVSLVQYGTGVDVSEIIQNFGVAVATTIAGIIFRILFNLARRDPVEVEHLSRLELADTSRKVRRELDSVILEFSHFRRTNQQMLAEAFEEIRAEVLKSAVTANEAVAGTAEAARARFNAETQIAETRRIAEQLKQTAALLGSVNASLADISATTAQMAATLRDQRHQDVWSQLRRWLGLPLARQKTRLEPAPAPERPAPQVHDARTVLPDFAAAIESELLPDVDAEVRPVAAPDERR